MSIEKTKNSFVKTEREKDATMVKAGVRPGYIVANSINRGIPKPPTMQGEYTVLVGCGESQLYENAVLSTNSPLSSFKYIAAADPFTGRGQLVLDLPNIESALISSSGTTVAFGGVGSASTFVIDAGLGASGIDSSAVIFAFDSDLAPLTIGARFSFENTNYGPGFILTANDNKSIAGAGQAANKIALISGDVTVKSDILQSFPGFKSMEPGGGLDIIYCGKPLFGDLADHHVFKAVNVSGNIYMN